jgi:predicted transcriptional regulator
MIFQNRRGEMEILNEMLHIALTEEKKTHLMYKTNLSYTVCCTYLNFLLEKGLLASKQGNPTGKIYYVTEKGKRFIDEFKDVYDLLQ